MIEIRFHGRGGQGAVIASKILAQAILNENESAVVQGFPEFGGERRGAPVAAYLRVDDRRKCKIYKPDYVVVLDDTLTGLAAEGLKENGWIVVNSNRPEKFVADFGGAFNLAFFDANDLARTFRLGPANQPIINTIILGVFAKASGLCGIEALVKAILESEDIPKDREKNAQAANEAFEKTRIVLTRGYQDLLRKGADIKLINTEDLKLFPRDSVRHPRNSVPLKLLAPITKKLMNVFKRGDWRMGFRPRYQTKTAPCQANCPAGNDIRGWLTLFKKGQVKEATELIQKTSPFPGVCGFVCPRFCEANCNRKDFDEAVAVNKLENKLGLGRLALSDMDELELPRAPKNPSSKIAVIGSGPAGLSCAWQLLRAGYQVTIFEKESRPGGMLTLAIPEFRLPKECAEVEINLILKSGAELKTGVEIGKDIAIDQLQAEYDAIFIAAGAHKNRVLDIPGSAESGGIAYGLNFLKNIEFFKPMFGKSIWRLVVIGGGNTAIDAARSAKRFGVDFVTVVYRRSEEEMPAQKSEVEEAKKEGIEFMFLSAPETIRGGALIKELRLRKMALGEPDETGRKRPVPTSECSVIGANLIVPAIGEEPDLDGIIGPFSEKSAEEKQRSVEMMESQGIFVGGDCLTGPSYVAQAIGQGREATEKIIAYLEGRVYEKPASLPLVYAKDLNLNYFEPAERQSEPQKEAERCLSCGLCPQNPEICKNCWQFCPDAAVEFKDGKFEINLDYCKGCLICSEECPRRVVNIEEEKKE